MLFEIALIVLPVFLLITGGFISSYIQLLKKRLVDGLAKFFQDLRRFFEVLVGSGTCSDRFESIRIHSDALGGVRKRLEAFGCFRKVFGVFRFVYFSQTFSHVFQRFRMFLDLLRYIPMFLDAFRHVRTCWDTDFCVPPHCAAPPPTPCAAVLHHVMLHRATPH